MRGTSTHSPFRWWQLPVVFRFTWCPPSPPLCSWLRVAGDSSDEALRKTPVLCFLPITDTPHNCSQLRLPGGGKDQTLAYRVNRNGESTVPWGAPVLLLVPHWTGAYMQGSILSRPSSIFILPSFSSSRLAQERICPVEQIQGCIIHADESLVYKSYWMKIVLHMEAMVNQDDPFESPSDVKW